MAGVAASRRQAHGVDAVVSGDRHLLDVASSELQVLTPRSWPTAWGSRLRADAPPSLLPAADLDAAGRGLDPTMTRE
jgi:hypothetical protein